VDDLTAAEHLLPGELRRPPAPPARSTRVAEAVVAARRLLEDEGPSALTMRRLADELGIRAPSLYKHFTGKAAVELALIEDALFDIGDVTHRALHEQATTGALRRLLSTYRRHCLAHPNLYRLATGGDLPRASLPQGLEEWAGNPWYVVTGDAHVAQALWSFAHGMVILELDNRYPPGSDLESTWGAGAAAFDRSAGRSEGSEPAPSGATGPAPPRRS
jgi:AcrR family transcriptional regulator